MIEVWLSLLQVNKKNKYITNVFLKVTLYYSEIDNDKKKDCP